MRRVAWIVGALLVLVVAIGAASVLGVIPGVNGCRLTSVDEQSYVARNEEVFRSIPLSHRLRASRATVYSRGIPALDSCLPLENSPPYERFVTTHVFLGEWLGYDEGRLPPGWVLQSFSGPMSTYRRGKALLSITETDDSVRIDVDHDAYEEAATL